MQSHHGNSPLTREVIIEFERMLKEQSIQQALEKRYAFWFAQTWPQIRPEYMPFNPRPKIARRKMRKYARGLIR